jgi:hypothetical protein
MKAIRILVAVLGLLPVIILACGCLHVSSGLSMGGERTAFIQDGQTYRDEVVATLGVPTYVYPAERVMAYVWETEGEPVYYTDMFRHNELIYQKNDRWQFCVSYDAAGLVSHHGVIRQPKPETSRETVLRWLAEGCPDRAVR